MKQTSIYGGLALGLLFTACSDDLNQPANNGGPLEKDMTFYVNMSIVGDIPETTRAIKDNGNPDEGTDFATGTENKVNNAYFVFYDGDGNVVGDIVPVELGEETKNPNGATVEASYRSVVPVSVRKGENKPTQVVCYINPISPSSLQNPLNSIQTRERDVVVTEGAGGDKYFAMSNSVYYLNSTAVAPQIAVPIPEELLFETESAAEEALDAANGVIKNPNYDSNVEGSEEYLPASDAQLVKIYVERYASKLQFNGTTAEAYKTATRVYPGTGTNTYDVVNVELAFTPQYWALNAEAKTSYVIKSFRQEAASGEVLFDNYTYQNLNSIINVALDGVNGGWEWNKPSYHRSYWSMSPAYFTAEYPEVSQDVVDNKLNQKYLKYSELATAGFPATNTTPQYFKETTVGSKALAGDNPAAAVASVILVGRYTIKVNDAAVTLPNGKGFYTYLSGPVDGVTDDRPYVYFDNQDGSMESVVAGGGSMLKRLCAQTTILFRQNADGSYTRLQVSNPEDVVLMGSGLAVKEIDQKVKEEVGATGTEALKLQANARSLQFKSAVEAEGIFIASGDGYKQIVADDATINEGEQKIKISQANAILMQQVGYAYYYINGDAYFNIPVKHYGWYRTGNTQKNATTIDWSKVRVGDFGMVRNHSYTITVNSITGLASGIGGENDPIVPPANTQTYYVAYSVKILKWAVVPVQNVDL